MLNRVVFPEPFGPISPAMLPLSTAIEQSLSACTPPYAFETPSARSNAVMTRSWWSARGNSRPWPRRLAVEVQPAQHRDDEAGDHEGGQLDPHGLDPEPAGPVLVVPDRPELETET